MTFRPDIIAGRAVILVNIQDNIDKQLRSIRAQLRRFSNSLGDIGGDLFTFGTAGTIGSIFPIKEFIDFQDQMLFLQTKLQITDAAMVDLEKTIRKLGMSTSFSSAEVAKAATMFAQAGFSATEITNALQAALDLARGSQIDLTTSTTILSNAIRTFGVDANRSAEFASKFITAARLGTLDLVDLGESLKYSSGTFASFGLGIEDVLGLITTLANSGLKASLAGTSLNTAFLNLASSAPELKELLGVELLEEDFVKPLQALRKLEKGLKTFSKIEQSSILEDLVNIRGGRAIQGLLLQGLDKLRENTDKITQSMVEARLSAEKLDSKLGGVGRRALSAFQELLLAIGATSEGPLTKFGTSLQKAFNEVSLFAGKNPELIQTLLLVPPAAVAAGVALLSFGYIANKLASLLTPLISINGLLFNSLAKLASANLEVFGKIGKKIGKGIGSLSVPSLLTKDINSASIIDKLATSFNKLGRSSSPLLDEVEAYYEAVGDFPKPSIIKQLQEVFPASQITATNIPSLSFVKSNAVQQQFKFTDAPIVAKSMARQLELAFESTQLELDFDIKPKSSFTSVGPAVAQFNSDAEKIINESVTKILGNKKARQALRQSSVPEKLLRDRLSRISDLPAQLIPRVLSEALSIVNVPQAAVDKKFTQELFDFKPNDAKQLGFQFQDLIEEATKPITKAPVQLGLFDNIVEEADKSTKKVDKSTKKAATVFRRRMSLESRRGVPDNIGAVRDLKPNRLALGFAKVAQVVRSIRTLLSSGILSIGKSIFSVNYLGKIVSGAKLFLSVFRKLFALLSGLRRFVFSFSGLLTIIEFLILSGPKIKPIKDTFDVISRSFSELSRNLGKLASDTLPAFQTIGKGLSQLFDGDLTEGITTIKVGINDLIQVIRTGLVDAWEQFVLSLSPALDKIRAFGNGLLQVSTTIAEIIGQIAGTTINGISSQFAGDSGQLFSVDGINKFFTVIVELVKTIGIQIAKFIGVIAEVGNLIKEAVFALLSAIRVLPGGDRAAEAADKLDVNFVARKSLEMAIKNLEAAQKGELRGGSDIKYREYGRQIDIFKKELEKLGPTTDSFKFEIQKVIETIENIKFEPFKQTTTKFSDTVGFVGPQKLTDAQIAARDAANVAKAGTVLADIVNGFNELKTKIKPVEVISSVEKSIKEGLSAVIKYLFPKAKLPSKVTVEAENVKKQVTSVVGSFESSRGTLLGVSTNKELKEANKNLVGIKEGIAKVENKLDFRFA